MELVKKFVMIGPESTGKTTLSKMLSDYFEEPWVPEFARDYLNEINRPYQQSDLLAMARGQLNIEDSLTLKANKFIFCDTDLLVIKVWSNHKYQQCDPWILQQIENRFYNHYFLCKNDFPWQQDSLRENPSQGDYFYSVFKEMLMAMNKPFTELEGSIENRMKKAIQIVGEMN